MPSQRHERANTGPHRLPRHTTCAACGKKIGRLARYVVLICKPACLKVAAYYYHCVACRP